MDKYFYNTTKIKRLRRTLYPYLLSGSLLILILGATVIGYFAYQNFNNIIVALEEEVKPNGDLVILNDISTELENVENALEGFVLNEDAEYMKNFQTGIQNAILLLDSLKTRNTDALFLSYTDSLHFLIQNKSRILTEVSKLDYQLLENTFADVEQQVVQKESTIVVENDLPEKKKGFLNKIFGKKKAKKSIETQPQSFAQKPIDSVVNKVKTQIYNQRKKEISLYEDHQNIDASLTSLISRMESWQIHRIKVLAAIAQNQAKLTNRYIVIFSVVAPIILLATLLILIIYVSRTRKHQQLLKSAKENAIKLAKEKEQFLANMSHEIRTPMNAIVGFSRLLQKTELNPSQQEQLSIITKSSDHLIHILNDILDFTKLQSGKINLEEKVFDPALVIKEIVQLLSHKAKEKGLILTTNLSDLPEYIKGDPFRLKQILLNLIFNSIKFTEQGNVTINAKTITKKGSTHIQLDVIDTGIGIPKEKQSKIFEDFEQVSQNDMQTGTGLGLSITKKLVNLHNGKISLKSKEGSGTTFSVKLVYKLAENENTTTKSNDSSHQYDISGFHMLIADDEAFNRKLLAVILSEQGITFDEAENGDETYKLLNEKKYDIVLLDFRMPKMNGPEITEKIRAEKKLNSEIPIIGLTATVSDQDMLLAKKSGINHVLRKPFDTEELLTLIEKELAEKPKKIESESESIPEFNLESLGRMGDETFVKEMVETFINSTTQNLDCLNKEIEHQNWGKTADIIHKMIAPTRHFKAKSLVSLLKKNEMSARFGKPIDKQEREKINQELLSLVASLQLYLRQT
ncbi:ATP-binding protein [Reichenbachiella sp. MALMAid0571]|uniref:ATP-binding protein n=1 Tax=Reichenbachiella sp. MALMAid0571 TaxID=3143939 RepID=UPI0032E02C1D